MKNYETRVLIWRCHLFVTQWKAEVRVGFRQLTQFGSKLVSLSLYREIWKKNFSGQWTKTEDSIFFSNERERSRQRTFSQRLTFDSSARFSLRLFFSSWHGTFFNVVLKSRKWNLVPKPKKQMSEAQTGVMGLKANPRKEGVAACSQRFPFFFFLGLTNMSL